MFNVPHAIFSLLYNFNAILQSATGKTHSTHTISKSARSVVTQALREKILMDRLTWIKYPELRIKYEGNWMLFLNNLDVRCKTYCTSRTYWSYGRLYGIFKILWIFSLSQFPGRNLKNHFISVYACIYKQPFSYLQNLL